MNLRQLAPLCLLLSLAPAAAPAEATTPSAVPSAPASTPAPTPLPKYERVQDLPAATHEAMKEFGQRLQSEISSGNTLDVPATFDLAAMADAMYANLPVPAEKIAGLRNGFLDRMPKELENLWAGWHETEPKFKGVVLYAGHAAVRFRFAGEITGISMQDLILAERPDGSLHIVDIYNHTPGTSLIEQLRQLFMPSILSSVPVDPKAKVPVTEAAQTRAFFQSSTKGEYDQAMQLYSALPQSVKDSKLVIGGYLNLLQQKGEHEAYKAAVRGATDKLKNGEFQLVLMNLYFLEKDYDKAIACVDAFMQQVEQDAVLMSLKALILKTKGDIKAAHALSREALKLEPYSTYVHASSLDILLATKDYAALRDSMLFLEKTGKYDFGPAMTNTEDWAEFKKSPEGGRWRKAE